MKQVASRFVFILPVIILMAASACKSYVKYKHGITNPKEETIQGLISFLDKNKFPLTNHYIFCDSSAYLKALGNDIFRKNLLGHMIFDKRGLLLVRDTTKCQWSGADLINNLHPDSTYGREEAYRVEQLAKNIFPITPVDTTRNFKMPPDFTIVVIWAKFLGHYNYRLFDLEPAVRQNKYAAIRLIWLNVDMQKSWHLKSGQKLSIK